MAVLLLFKNLKYCKTFSRKQKRKMRRKEILRKRELKHCHLDVIMNFEQTMLIRSLKWSRPGKL